MLLTCSEMKAAEEALFATGVEAEELMEKAGLGIANAIANFAPRAGTCVLYLGTGHNAGDAFVAAKHLRERGWKIRFRYADPDKSLASLTRKKLDELFDEDDGPIAPPLVLLDGMLGIGAKGPLREKYQEAAAEMNQMRLDYGATTFAIDIPSGLDGDSGHPHDDAVVADYTLTIAHPKLGLVADRAINHVGRLALIELDEIQPLEGQGRRDLTLASCRLPRRRFDTHKGMAGRVGVVAGSRGYLGAAKLCTEGALRSGAGLVTLYAHEDVYPMLVAMVSPEIMVKPVTHFTEILDDPLDVIAIGPGLANMHDREPLQIMREDPRPMVIDASALNMVAKHQVTDFAGPRLLTPHPGEMARLMGVEKITGDRLEVAQSFVEQYAVTLLFKGARTIIAEAGKPFCYNTTGHPGMATGGVGDVLTGMCASLVGQGLSLYDAAITASWLSGHAAEVAVLSGESQESFLPSDIPKYLGRAMSQVNRQG